MLRIGQLIGIRKDKLEYYKYLHQNTWPEVLAAIHDCNIRNYSVFYKDNMLFAYYEYVGTNYHDDMKKMSLIPEVQKWWRETDPCQIPLETRQAGEWWANMEEVFHQD